MKNFISLTVGTLALLSASFALAQDNEFHLDEVYSIGKDGTIILSSDDADIYIIGSDRSDVHVKIDRVVESKGIKWGEKNFDVKVSESGGNLRIEDKEWGNRSGMVGYSREEYVIRIEAPGGIDLDLIGDDDDYKISFISGDIKIKADDANIMLENCSSKSLNFDTDDSDVVLKGAAGELTASMDDGDITVYNGRLTSIDIRGDDSDIDIETSLTDNGTYRFNIEDSSLDLHITEGGGTFEIRHDDGRISSDGDFTLIEDEEDYSEYRLSGGKARVRISGDDLSVRLNSGRIN
jgi:hypothetical protein